MRIRRSCVLLLLLVLLAGPLVGARVPLLQKEIIYAVLVTALQGVRSVRIPVLAVFFKT